MWLGVDSVKCFLRKHEDMNTDSEHPCLKNKTIKSQAQQHIHVIPALGKWKLEDTWGLLPRTSLLQVQWQALSQKVKWKTIKEDTQMLTSHIVKHTHARKNTKKYILKQNWLREKLSSNPKIQGVNFTRVGSREVWFKDIGRKSTHDGSFVLGKKKKNEWDASLY